MMLGALLELMTEAARHEVDDYGQIVLDVDYDTLHNSLAEIAVLLFATNESGIGSNPNVYRRNVLAPTAPLRLMTDDNSTLPMKADDANAGANLAPGQAGAAAVVTCNNCGATGLSNDWAPNNEGVIICGVCDPAIEQQNDAPAAGANPAPG
jgi:hypothetical protein